MTLRLCVNLASLLLVANAGTAMCSSSQLDTIDWGCCERSSFYSSHQGDERTPSPYDSDSLRYQIVSMLEADRVGEPEEKYWYRHWEMKADDMWLRWTMDCGNDSDFVILAYGFRLLKDARIYVGFWRSTGSIFILSEGFGQSVEERYNNMVHQHGCPRLTPLCIAAVLVTLKYGYEPTTILERPEDAFAAAGILTAPMPRKVLSALGAPWIVLMSPSRDTSVLVMSRLILGQLMNSERITASTASMVEMGIGAPSVSTDHDTTTVIISTYSYQVEGEVAIWKVVFAGDGSLVHMWYQSPPLDINLPGIHRDRLSPHKRSKPFQAGHAR